MDFFGNNGRRVPENEHRVFNSIPSYFYKLNKPQLNLNKIHNDLIEFKMIGKNINLNIFASTLESLSKAIESDKNFTNLMRGICLPFAYKNLTKNRDIGDDLICNFLPSLKTAFEYKYPQSKFKAVHQSNIKLEGNLQISKYSRYDQFIEKSYDNTIIGWYFPQALQEYDIESQKLQMKNLPSSTKFEICLSGGKDIFTSIIGSTEVLISDEFYTPILCLTSYQHVDPRIVLTLKSYGPHLEFWSMTQMLSKEITQVSEQWSGGITIYKYV